MSNNENPHPTSSEGHVLIDAAPVDFGLRRNNKGSRLPTLVVPLVKPEDLFREGPGFGVFQQQRFVKGFLHRGRLPLGFVFSDIQVDECTWLPDGCMYCRAPLILIATAPNIFFASVIVRMLDEVSFLGGSVLPQGKIEKGPKWAFMPGVNAWKDESLQVLTGSNIRLFENSLLALLGKVQATDLPTECQRTSLVEFFEDLLDYLLSTEPCNLLSTEPVNPWREYHGRYLRVTINILRGMPVKGCRNN